MRWPVSRSWTTQWWGSATDSPIRHHSQVAQTLGSGSDTPSPLVQEDAERSIGTLEVVVSQEDFVQLMVSELPQRGLNHALYHPQMTLCDQALV